MSTTPHGSLFSRRYGIRRDSRLPVRISFRWPVQIKRLHVFHAVEEDKWHSDKCWCRRA